MADSPFKLKRSGDGSYKVSRDEKVNASGLADVIGSKIRKKRAFLANLPKDSKLREKRLLEYDEGK